MTATPPRLPQPYAGARRAASVLGIGAAAASFGGLYVVAVCTARGQWWDERVWWWLHAVSPYGPWQAAQALGTITPARCLVALLTLALVAVAQRRARPALVGIACAAGTFVSTELLKHTLVRPDLGVSGYDLNSFPSGHTGAVAALAVMALVALGHASRVVVTLLAAGATVATGLGVVLAGWHRPSDVVASALVATVWGLAGLLLAGRRRDA